MRYRPPVSDTDVLVVTTHSPDLESFGQVLGGSLSGKISGLRVSARSIAIGLAGVSASLAARITDLRPRAVVLVGTCASYPGRNLAPGHVVVANRIVLADAGVLKGWSSFPGPMTGTLDTHRSMTSALLSTGPRAVTVASTLAVTVDASLAQAFVTQLGCDAEHLEAFGAAMACAPSQLPFAVVLGVSHEVGPNARETWRVTHRQAAQAAAALVTAWLHTGGAGVPHGA